MFYRVKYFTDTWKEKEKVCRKANWAYSSGEIKTTLHHKKTTSSNVKYMYFTLSPNLECILYQQTLIHLRHLHSLIEWQALQNILLSKRHYNICNLLFYKMSQQTLTETMHCHSCTEMYTRQINALPSNEGAKLKIYHYY